MAIVKVYNKARNLTYVYEFVSYWNKELKQSRSHLKLIGRINPVTGDIISTGKRIKKKILPLCSKVIQTIGRCMKRLFQQ